MVEERIHPYTLFAGALMLALTVPFAMAAWSMWQVSATPLDPAAYQRVAVSGVDTGFADLFGRTLSREDARFWIRLSGGFLGVLCAFTASLSIGVALRREWARHTAMVVFLLFGLISVPLALGGAFATPRPAGLTSAVVVASGTVLVLLLLASIEVADDIARGTFYRERKRRPRSDDLPHGRGDEGPPEPPILAA